MLHSHPPVAEKREGQPPSDRCGDLPGGPDPGALGREAAGGLQHSEGAAEPGHVLCSESRDQQVSFTDGFSAWRLRKTPPPSLLLFVPSLHFQILVLTLLFFSWSF